MAGSLRTFMKADEACKRSVRYLRVSTKRQTDTDADITDDGNSIDTQRKATIEKEHTLGSVNVGEYVEPGTSAQSIEKRKEFRKLLERIIEQRDVDYVIIYQRSRVFRNHIDAAIVKRQLEKLGVKLISAKEDFGDGIMADAMEAITDIFNEIQVKLNGQDVAVKMRNKAENGGWPGLAKLGYQNVSRIFDGHKVNTIGLDPDRHDLITAAFELFATGEHTVDTLHDLLVEASLTNPHTRTPVSRHTVHKMLRDPYYMGNIVWKGIDYGTGRHQRLVTPEVFDRVQRVLDAHHGSGTRTRNHPHYLKGTIWCDRCKHRFTVQRAVGARGGIYYYFLCVGRARGLCDHPYIPVEVVEQAVIDHYTATIGIPADFRAQITAGLDTAMASDFTLSDQLRDAFTKRLAALKRKESYFLDLAAEEDWDKEELRAKINALRIERRDITRQLDDANRRLEIGQEIITHVLTLLDQPARLYQHGDEAIRTILNTTFFTRLYIDGERVTSHDHREPFNVIDGAHSLYRTYHSHGPTNYQPGGSTTPPKTSRTPKKTGGKATHITSTNSKAATPNRSDGPTDDPLTLLQQTTQVKGWNKATLVGLTGFEPATP